MKTVLLRLSGFTLLPLLSLVIPLLLLPVISGIVGPEGISSVMAGQAIGLFGTSVIMWGWNVDGPVAIAHSVDHHGRSQVYLSSIRTRLVLLVVTAPVTTTLAALVALPEFRTEAVSMALASLFLGMSPSWYCIGLGNPKMLAVFDTLPRFLATIASVPLLLLTNELWTYTLLLAVATAAALVAFHRRISPGGAWFPSDLGGTFKAIGEQAHTAGINVAGVSYGSTPVPIATATTSASASGALATADTLYRFGLFTVYALANALQAWVLERGVHSSHKRQLLGIGSHVVLGIVGAATLTLLGPSVSNIVFAGQARADMLTCMYYGFAFFFISASTPFIRNLLIPAGKSRLVLMFTATSAILGIAGMVLSGLSGHISGIALSMALSELLLFAFVLIPGLRTLSRKHVRGSP